MIGCTTSSHKGQTIITPDGKRIFIPQEKISFDRPAPPKIIPYTYNAWLSVGDTLARVREYEVFLERNGVGNIIPSFELLRTARDWQKCGQCAGGANSSRHLFNSAIDFRIGSENPQPEDYAYIENTKYRLCQFWTQHGQSLNMGLGLYASGQIHIDTQGYRTWGPDLSRNSSMCSY